MVILVFYFGKLLLHLHCALFGFVTFFFPFFFSFYDMGSSIYRVPLLSGMYD